MYGKNNRILYSAEFPQGFKVVADKRTRQATGVFSGVPEICVTRAETSLNGTFSANSEPVRQ
jgi:hypothetical protein